MLKKLCHSMKYCFVDRVLMMAWGNPQVILGGARPLANHQSTIIYHLYPVLSTYVLLYPNMFMIKTIMTI